VTEQPVRPFYSEYAWAFDLLIDRPVRKECGAIAAWLVERGVLPGATLLDAGCGTGRYAIELARRGFIVHGIDRSTALIDVARRSVEQSSASPSFAVADILDLPAGGCQAILCRGVLNDFVDDSERAAVFGRFARALEQKGVLILDVREWGASAARKRHEPLFRKRVETDRGTLTFTSVTELDPETRQLVVSEEHILAHDDETRSSRFDFVMRCWTRDELASALGRAGFGSVAWFGAYDAAVEAGSTDRLVAVAQLSTEPSSQCS
jgi:SAM-dependent methyltransferase